MLNQTLLRWRYFSPSPPLRALVDAIYVMRSDQALVDSPAGALLPQLHWLISGWAAWSFDGGAPVPFALASLVGPSEGAMRLQVAGPTRIVGLGLFPEGWSALIGEAAHRLTTRVIDATAVLGSAALLPLCDGPFSADEEIVAAVDALLLRVIGRGRRPGDWRTTMIAAWANGERHDVDALSRALGVSSRQVERLVLASCGVPPKLLASKQRMLRLATMMREGVAPAELWPDHYADQSHFIRHFRRFVGMTPRAFAGGAPSVAGDVFGARAAIRSPHALGLFTGAAPPLEPRR